MTMTISNDDDNNNNTGDNQMMIIMMMMMIMIILITMIITITTMISLQFNFPKLTFSCIVRTRSSLDTRSKSKNFLAGNSVYHCSSRYHNTSCDLLLRIRPFPSPMYLDFNHPKLESHCGRIDTTEGAHRPRNVELATRTSALLNSASLLRTYFRRFCKVQCLFYQI